MYELKAANVFVFSHHEGYFYLMDDSLTFKKFIYDKRTLKFKLLKTFEFSNEHKDILVNFTEFENVEVTNKGVYKHLMFLPFYDSAIYNKD